MNRLASNWKTNLMCFVGALLLVSAGCDKATVDKAGAAVKDKAKAAEEAVGDAVKAGSETASEMKDALGAGFAEAAEKASAALKDVEGGGELLKGLKDMFASAQESLKGITDNVSAEAAVSKLGDLEGKLSGLSDTMKKLPDEAKPAIKSVVEQGIAQLKALVDKVMTLPGVQDVLKPKLDELMAKLEGLTS